MATNSSGEMNSFYSTETLFSVNYFTDAYAGNRFTIGAPVPAGQGYEPTRNLPPRSSIGKSEPRHNMSKPPQHRVSRSQQALVVEVQTTTNVEPIRINTKTTINYVPEPFEPITPDFLLQKIPERRQPQADSPDAPPRMTRHLSDPCFLLGNGPTESSPEPVAPAKQQPILIEVWDRERDGACWEEKKEPVAPAKQPVLIEVWDRERDGACWEEEKKAPTLAVSRRSGSIESFMSSESLGSKLSLASNSTTATTSSASRRIQERRKKKVEKKEELRWGTIKKKKRKVKQIQCGNFYNTKARCRVTRDLAETSREIWTIPRGTKVEIQQIDFVSKRCCISCECKYFSKYDARSAGPRTRYVDGWMSYKNKLGWVLWI